MRNSKYLVINSREKILSPDINNGHALVLRSAMEIVRAAYLNTHNGASDVQAVATAAPLRALVLSGLCVLPQDGSFDLYVSAGAVVMAIVSGALFFYSAGEELIIVAAIAAAVAAIVAAGFAFRTMRFAKKEAPEVVRRSSMPPPVPGGGTGSYRPNPPA